MSKAVETLSRRAMICGGAAVIPAAVVGATPALASSDAELITLGSQLKPLIHTYFDAICDWAPRQCEVSRKSVAQFGPKPITICNDPQRAAWNDLHGELRPASERLSLAHEAIEPLAKRIMELSATTLDGLRAKALVALWWASPYYAPRLEWDWPEGDEWRSLFDSVVELTGLAPMVRHLEARIEAVAMAIRAAGGDGRVEEAADEATA